MKKNEMKMEDFTSIVYAGEGQRDSSGIDTYDLFTCEMQGRSDKLTLEYYKEDGVRTPYIVSEAMGDLSDCMEENQIFQLSFQLEGIKAFSFFKERISKAESITEFEELFDDICDDEELSDEQYRLLLGMLEEREKEVFPNRGSLSANDIRKLVYIGESEDGGSIYTCEIQSKSDTITCFSNETDDYPDLSPTLLNDRGEDIAEKMYGNEIEALSYWLENARLYSSYKEEIAEATSLKDFDEIYERVSEDYKNDNLQEWQNRELIVLLRKATGKAYPNIFYILDINTGSKEFHEVDAWRNGGTNYVVGQSTHSGIYCAYCTSVNGRTYLEFKNLPKRAEVEQEARRLRQDHLNE